MPNNKNSVEKSTSALFLFCYFVSVILRIESAEKSIRALRGFWAVPPYRTPSLALVLLYGLIQVFRLEDDTAELYNRPLRLIFFC